MRLKVDGRWFKDEHGRAHILRGVNLSGASKVPTIPNGATHLPDSLNEREDMTFIGRPFPLDEADEHFARLKHWGLDFLRFVVTWEALEHKGPGQYDEDFIDYLEAILEKAYEYDINMFIDPHQDVWSRFSGGDGAPAWTFDVVGLDLDCFTQTGAAILHQNTKEEDYPNMTWATNYNKFASMTMFTLFYGGNTFAPSLTYQGETVQDFLQTHYCNAFAHLAKRIAHLPNVLGFGTMNEPHNGFIGVPDLREDGHVLVKVGVSPTPAQAMYLASGFAQECADYQSPLGDYLPGQITQTTIDPKGMTVWQEGCEDIWQAQGIWDIKDGEPRLLRPAHFARINGEIVDFNEGYLKPFTEKFRDAIHAVMPEAHIFVEAEPFEPPPTYENSDKLVFAPHFYEGITLFTKRFSKRVTVDLETFRPLLGATSIENYMERRLGKFRQFADEHMGDVPVLIGEFGIPFDLNYKYAYETGDFSLHAVALHNYYQAMDDHLFHYTQWNYTPDNTNEHGDLWNREDLSIFSRDQQTDPSDINSGGRALSAVVRPYAKKVAGEPLNMRFDPVKGIFTFSFRHDPDITEPTEIFVPNTQFPAGYRVEVTDGEYEIKRDEQLVIYRHTDKDIPHMVRVISNTPPPPELTPYGKMAIIAGIVLFVLLLLSGGNKKKKDDSA